MTKLIRKNQKGFTLIELMIVVAIIGILAAIAIPNFLNYQLKSKTAEAKTNLGGIKTAQESYRAENDTYRACSANPSAVPAGVKAAWTATGTGFDVVGFAPAGSVYYQYAVAITGTTSFTATATGNLDADSANASFTLDQTGALTGPLPANEF